MINTNEIKKEGPKFVVRCPRCGRLLGHADNREILDGIWACDCDERFNIIKKWMYK